MTARRAAIPRRRDATIHGRDQKSSLSSKSALFFPIEPARHRLHSQAFAVQVDGPRNCEHTPGSLKLFGSIGGDRPGDGPVDEKSPGVAGRIPAEPRLLFESTGSTSSPSRTWIVMRQAVTTMMVGLFLALSPVAPVSASGDRRRGDDRPGEAAGRGQGLFPGGDPAGRPLPEADAKERRSILELLRQSYEAMAREAKAAGNDREAAHLQDNIAIIDRSADRPRPRQNRAKRRPTKPAPSPKPAVARNQNVGRHRNDPSSPSRGIVSAGLARRLPAGTRRTSARPEPAKSPARTLPSCPKSLSRRPPAIGPQAELAVAESE